MLMGCFSSSDVLAQTELKLDGSNVIGRDAQGRLRGAGSKMKGGDSLQQRDSHEDSITIFFRYLDSSRIHFLDSSVHDFYRHYMLPADHKFLVNIGGATQPLIFKPTIRPGFDAGFHGFDVYRLKIEDTKIYQTTRPYTELSYILGPRAEQNIGVLHTQNIKPNWNNTFEFRYINSPGNLANANSSHSNIRFTSSFTNKTRRYSGNFIFLNNRNRAAENGGIQNDSFMTSTNSAYFQRFNIPTWLGADGVSGVNPFSVNIQAGNDYKMQTVYFKHQYDLGQSDSLMQKDSSYVKIFYPRFRLQHLIKATNSVYQYEDKLVTAVNSTYSKRYLDRYNLLLTEPSFLLKDRFFDVTNEGNILIFPQKNNQEQFIKAGAGYQWFQGQFDNAVTNFSNLYLQGEYRNRTRNRKWDINASGKLYLSGYNSGDYSADLQLISNLGARLGSLELFFKNVNRQPSFVFDNRSSFLMLGNQNFNKENWTVLGGNLYLTKFKMKLGGEYTLVNNYTYWSNYYEATQTSTVQNVLHISGEKKFKLSKYWNLYSSVHVQHATGGAINIPPVYTRQILAYEGNFYKNLNLSMGFDVRYAAPYKSDFWSPFNGQWVVQDSVRINNKPDIAAFFHFRVRTMKMFIRAENLNTMTFKNGFGFRNNNFATDLYPTPGYFLRFGFAWGFIN